MPVEEQKIREGRLILKAVTRDDYLVILDEKGREHNTREFADRLEKIFQLSRKRVVFVIGGPWGFSNDVYDRADMKFSLSRLTFSHQLVRLLFAEQLYRVLTLIKGDPYHHE
jgi:23S rRNA (pseudouridine1915-N3)-methyltransferase